MAPRNDLWFAPISVIVVAGLALSVAGASAASGASPRPANPPSASSVPLIRQHMVDDQGDVQLRVPRVVIATTDGLPASLVVGTHYVLELHVWVAGGESPLAASIDVAGSATNECASSTLPAATISTIRCQVVPTAAQAGMLAVTVRVGPHDAPVATARFTHVVSPHQAYPPEDTPATMSSGGLIT